MVLIDDFNVTDDDGYGFDDYGPRKALDLDYLGDATRKFNHTVHSPPRSSNDETGAKRGRSLLSLKEDEEVVE